MSLEAFIGPLILIVFLFGIAFLYTSAGPVGRKIAIVLMVILGVLGALLIIGAVLLFAVCSGFFG